MEGILSCTNLPLENKARQYMQLQNRFLAYKNQLNLLLKASITTQPLTNSSSPRSRTTGNNSWHSGWSAKCLINVPGDSPQPFSTMAISTPLPPPSLHPSWHHPPQWECQHVENERVPKAALWIIWIMTQKRPSRHSRHLHRDTLQIF